MTVVRSPGGANPTKVLGIPPFKPVDIPGKGRGLVARFDIPRGTRILCEKPLLTMRSMPWDQAELALAAKLKALSREGQRQFLSLRNNHPGKYPFSGIFKANALPCGSGASDGGIYPTICLINHSCLPNSHNSWNSDAKHETIHAIRPIKADEEITISYDRGDLSAAVRQAFLKQTFEFDCTCSGCSLPASELQASDARRLSIQRLDKAIGSGFRMANNPKESLGDCHSLLRVMEQEYGGCAVSHSARLYYDAFQVCIAHGDQARASVFAGRAHEARVICEGEDSPETQRAKSLSLNPAGHPTTNLCSTSWKTEKNKIPKGLSTEQFEKWLWREETVNR